MTPASLRQRVEAAWRGPWRVDDPMDGESYVISITPADDPEIVLAMDIAPEDAVLMALAPDLASLVADMAEDAALLLRFTPDPPLGQPGFAARNGLRRALARFAALGAAQSQEAEGLGE